MTAKRLKLVGLGVALLINTQSFAQDNVLPSDDFLEYLATLVDQDGEWVDPLELEEFPDELPDELNPDNTHELLETDAQHAEETP